MARKRASKTNFIQNESNLIEIVRGSYIVCIQDKEIIKLDEVRKNRNPCHGRI